MAEWSTAETNNFPDSSFAFIAPGGTKDDEGKTVPRTLRKLPYKDGAGKVDLPHVRNALARLNQTDDIPADKKDSIKTMLQNILSKEQASSERVYQMSTIKLDSGGAPNRVLLMKTGNWPNSVKGNFSISVDDLKQIKENFDKGIGFPTEDASTGLPIDFKHEYQDEAAGWIKGLELQVSGDGNSAELYADPIEWSDKGAEAVQNGRFKGISASGGFGKKGDKLGAWVNPTNLKEKIRNVLDGAGLTNIPFLRGMSPIRASATDDIDTQFDYDNVMFISDSQKNKGATMTIDAIRVKAKDELSADEKTFLDEHKNELSAEEREKFGYEKENVNELSAEDKALLTDENKELLAAIKSGEKVVVDKSQTTADQERLSALETTVKGYEAEKAESIVALHVKRGAIKSDSSDFWTKQLLSTTGAERTALEDQLKALPSNEELSKEIGTGEDVPAGSTAREQLAALATKKVEAAAKEGKTLLFSDALRSAYKENEDLKTQDIAEQTKGGN